MNENKTADASCKVLRPDIVDIAHLEYLDDLRESGVTNMFGAPQYLREVFDLNRKDSNDIVSYWMKSFGERSSN